MVKQTDYHVLFDNHCFPIVHNNQRVWLDVMIYVGINEFVTSGSGCNKQDRFVYKNMELMVDLEQWNVLY